MVDFQAASAIVFFILLALFLFWKRKNVTLQKVLFPFLYIMLYKTKIGIEAMDKYAKRYPRIVKVAAIAGIVVGFMGMALISFVLVQNFVALFTVPKTVPAVQPILPFKAKGVFYVPFFYLIISIAIVAIIHEFSHGLIARAFKIKIKSSGFAFLGIIFPVFPAAFVEPDEKQLAKQPAYQQLAVFAAGPFSNILLGFLVAVLILTTITPVNNYFFMNNGVDITGFPTGASAAQAAGIQMGERVISLDNKSTTDIDNFSMILKTKKAGQRIHLVTNRTSYDITLGEHPNNSSAGYLGIIPQQDQILKPEVKSTLGEFVPAAVIWIYGFLFILYIVNIGIGLVNLLPTFVVDGGRMSHVALLKMSDKKVALRIWKYISIFFGLIILIELSFIFKFW